MFVENLSNDNVFIFSGIAVPARGTLSVALEMQTAIETSPLIADYVKAGILRLSTDVKASEQKLEVISVKTAEVTTKDK